MNHDLSPLIAEKDLPKGALERYIRDIYAISKLTQSLPSGQSFEDFKEEWEKMYEESVRVRNRDHPVEHDHTFKFNQYCSVHIFKRKGEDWSCSQCNMASNEGEGKISLEEALKMINNTMEILTNPFMHGHSK